MLTNPNCEFEVNFVAMHSLATWWKSFPTATSSTIDQSENSHCEGDSTETVPSKFFTPPQRGVLAWYLVCMDVCMCIYAGGFG